MPLKDKPRVAVEPLPAPLRFTVQHWRCRGENGLGLPRRAHARRDRPYGTGQLRLLPRALLRPPGRDEGRMQPELLPDTGRK